MIFFTNISHSKQTQKECQQYSIFHLTKKSITSYITYNPRSKYDRYLKIYKTLKYGKYFVQVACNRNNNAHLLLDG